MFKPILLTLIFALLACDLISEKGGHALLLKLEKELTNYNTKIKQEKIAYEKEKKSLKSAPQTSSNNNNYHSPILSQKTTTYLNEKIKQSKALEQKCKEIIEITSKKIQEMDELYNKALKMKEEANNINKEFENSRNSNSTWSSTKKAKVDQLNQQIKNKISSATYWPEETKKIYKALKNSIETTINNSIDHTYHLEQDIRTGQIPEDWISRISDHNQSANEIITKYEQTIKASAKQSDETANEYITELDKIINEALNIINNTSYK